MDIISRLNDCDLTLDDCRNMVDRLGHADAADIMWDDHTVGVISYDDLYDWLVANF